MCISLHTNFYHNCGHEQFVLIPSVNPTCPRQLESLRYVENEYCPRCTWKGKLLRFAFPRVWQELGAGIPCQGFTGQVMRTIRMPWYAKYNYTKRTLWQERNRYYRLKFEYIHRKHERNMAAERLEQQRNGESALDWVCFLRASRPGVLNPSPDVYCEFADESGDHLDEISEDRDTCAICQNRTNLGPNDPESCQGSGYIDEAGNMVGGEPVFLLCRHVFGLGCIRQWIEGSETLTQHDTCPMCQNVFEFHREVPYRAPPWWAAAQAYDTLPITGKIMYWPPRLIQLLVVFLTPFWEWCLRVAQIPSTMITGTQQWYATTRVEVARFREWRQILRYDRENFVAWIEVMVDYYVYLTLVSLCLSHPFWLSCTNVLMATIGAATYWWSRPRPLAGEGSERFAAYLIFSFLGNFAEWLIENLMRGWFVRWYDYVWALVYLLCWGRILWAYT
ncbi:uncharacterized protein LY89DRAFT_736413 [Mollisia scopiformis]|uniref:RING-type domain-containing protein n=1 Tax=Mollisia scopiformis TaxID=149040 RepID=A0A194X3G7_MOLSC|nr:uncharacterized protein LY89DRAFT_736413 [Mollisia scopiformis]KUJ14367.1 hypothetical protein LY89DRAFT_736413 [Mollisia scopiformis]